MYMIEELGGIMKYAVALEGGGSKGAYHAGALKAMQDLDIMVEAIAGTSIGSINGAYYIQEGPEALYNFWENISPDQLIPDGYEILKQTLIDGNVPDYRQLLKELRKTVQERGLELTKLKETLHQLINEDKIRNSSIDFGLVTVSITDLKSLELMIGEIPQNQLIEYLMASSYLPVFKQEKFHGKHYIDGAFYDNLPINLLVRNGYKHVIAIESLGTGIKRRVKDKTVELIYIKPSEDTGNLIDFREEVNTKNLLMGYYDTLRALSEVYGHVYYLKDMIRPEAAYSYIDRLSKDQIEGLAEILNIKMIPHKRCLFERIVPKLMELLDVPQEADYNMILVYILEHVANSIGINRFQLITMEELIEQVKKGLEHYGDEDINWNESIVKLLKTTKLYTHTFKDQVIIACVQLMMTGIQGGDNGLQS